MGLARRLVPALVLATVALAAPPAQAARPNLATVKLANPPKAAVVGAAFRVRDATANRGRARAARSTTRFYLSDDRKRSSDDLLMQGAREVPALGRGERSAAPRKRRVMGRVDVGTPRGTYFLLACADDRARVRESKEGDNCRSSRRKVRITDGFRGPIHRFDAFADATPLIDEARDEESLVSRKPYMCAPRPKKPVPGLKQAIETIEATIRGRVGKADYGDFRRSPAFKNATAAQNAAATAFALGQPGAALAAMVRAHELEPKDSSHLVNAAGLASAVGLPHEALAMLDAAEALDDRDRPGMGISRQAVALANRAHALTALSRYGPATGAADAALSIEPLLSEAQLSAGMADLCAGRTKPAVARIRRGRKRQPDKDPPLNDEKGKESSLRNLPLAAFPPQTVDLAPFYRDQQGQDRLADMQARNEREMQIRQRINARQNDPSRAINDRLLFAVNLAGTTPRLEALQDEIGALFQKSHTWWQEKWCDGDSCHDEEYGQIAASCAGADDTDACIRQKCIPATKNWHQGWLNDNAALYQKSQEYYRAFSRRASAIASHIKDPDYYALAMLAIESEEDSLYFGAQQPAYYWADWTARHKHHCVEGYEPPPSLAGTDPTAAQGSGPCPDGLKSANAVLDLGIATLKVNCSEIQVGASAGAGWIKGFAEVTYDFRSGKATLFAGSQAEGGVGPLKADFKSGIYVTGSAQGIEDIGMRAGPSTSIGGGPVEFSGASDSVDISFVAAFSG